MEKEKVRTGIPRLVIGDEVQLYPSIKMPKKAEQTLFNLWVGKTMTIVSIESDEVSSESFIKVKENCVLWRKSYFKKIDLNNQDKVKNQKENKMKMKKVMKTIRSKVALNKELTNEENLLVTLAGTTLYKQAIKDQVLTKSWDIKQQEAVINMKDADGNIVPEYYFQLVACGTNPQDFKRFDWIEDEISKLTLKAAESEIPDLTSVVLFKSNQLTITVSVFNQMLTMNRTINRTIKKESGRIATTYKTHVYKYSHDRLGTLAADLIASS